MEIAAAIKQREQEKLADAARDKLARGEEPTVKERRAFEKVERRLTEEYGRVFVEKVTKAIYSEWSGRQQGQLYSQADRYGIPIRGDGISIPAVIRWMHDFIGEVGRRRSPDEDDVEPELLPGSRELERLRAAKADMAEDERDIKRGELAPISEFKEFLVRWSQRLRMAGEIMSKPTCADPHAVFLDALDDCERMVFDKYPDVEPSDSQGK